MESQPVEQLPSNLNTEETTLNKSDNEDVTEIKDEGVELEGNGSILDMGLDIKLPEKDLMLKLICGQLRAYGYNDISSQLSNQLNSSTTESTCIEPPFQQSDESIAQLLTSDINPEEPSHLLTHLVSRSQTYLNHKLGSLLYTPVPLATSIPLIQSNLEGKIMSLEQEPFVLEQLNTGNTNNSNAVNNDNELELTENAGLEIGDEEGTSELPALGVWFTTAHKLQARTAAFSNDGVWLATGSADCSLKVLDVAKLKRRSEDEKPVVKALYDHTGPVNELAFHPNGQVLASGADDACVKLFDLSKAQVKKAFRYLQDSHPIKSIHFHPSGDFLAVATDHERLRIYDVRTFQCYTPPPTSHHRQGLTSIRYSSDGRLIATSSLDGDIKLWDGNSGGLIRTIATAHSKTAVGSLEISKSGKYLLSSGLDSVVRLWDLGSGKQVAEYLGAHTPWTTNAAFSYNEYHVLTPTSEPNHGIVAWNTKSMRRVATIPAQPYQNPQPIQTLVASPIENHFVTCSDDARVRYWGESG